MTGHIADQHRLTAVDSRKEIEKISAEIIGHDVFDADAAPVAERRAFGEKQLLYLPGEKSI